MIQQAMTNSDAPVDVRSRFLPGPVLELIPEEDGVIWGMYIRLQRPGRKWSFGVSPRGQPLASILIDVDRMPFAVTFDEPVSDTGVVRIVDDLVRGKVTARKGERPHPLPAPFSNPRYALRLVGTILRGMKKLPTIRERYASTAAS